MDERLRVFIVRKFQRPLVQVGQPIDVDPAPLGLFPPQSDLAIGVVSQPIEGIDVAAQPDKLGPLLRYVFSSPGRYSASSSSV